MRYNTHIGGGGLNLLMHEWVLPKSKVHGEIIIYHVGSKSTKVPALKLLHTCKFSHLKMRGQKFLVLKYFQEYVERAKKIRGTWKDGGWNNHSLGFMYNRKKFYCYYEENKKTR